MSEREKELIESAARLVGEKAKLDYREGAELYDDFRKTSCQSPIERMFAIAWDFEHEMLAGEAAQATDWIGLDILYCLVLTGEAKKEIQLREAPQHSEIHDFGSCFRETGSTLNFDLLFPQFQIQSMRVDFLAVRFVLNFDFPPKPHREYYTRGKQLVIECDGFDFHERTLEQAKSDRERDRKLQSLGYRVFRFMGSDLYRDPFKCARECIKALAEDAK